jgi:hypothetical protein
MTAKVVRGQLLVFKSTPKDADVNITTPTSMKLYLNYHHPTDPPGENTTDPPINMDPQIDGRYRAEFDTKVCEPGAAFASIRAEAPPAADDIKFTIVANEANPDP